MKFYSLIDGCKLEAEITFAKDLNKSHLSLYKGRSEEDLADVAPYLFTFGSETEFSKFYIDNGWGNAWGVFLNCSVSFEEIWKHFRKFLLVQTEDGEELYFRFYDPRVLRIFLPTCDSNQLNEFFGPVEYFICEDEDPFFGLKFSFENNKLITERLTKEGIFGLDGAQKNRKFFGQLP